MAFLSCLLLVKALNVLFREHNGNWEASIYFGISIDSIEEHKEYYWMNSRESWSSFPAIWIIYGNYLFTACVLQNTSKENDGHNGENVILGFPPFWCDGKRKSGKDYFPWWIESWAEFRLSSKSLVLVHHRIRGMFIKINSSIKLMHRPRELNRLWVIHGCCGINNFVLNHSSSQRWHGDRQTDAM